MKRPVLFAATILIVSAALAQSKDLYERIDAAAEKINPQTIAWRRDFHRHPELGNREVRTAKIVADYLRSLGLDVTEQVAHTGVVALLRGGKPGPVVALRADMDGLPVTERTPVPFASKDSTVYNGRPVGVMHACGHDTHMAMLLSAAEILTALKKELHGTVKFIFQPAEEGAPAGETGGGEEMVKEGVLDNPRVDAIFGLHINSQTEVGTLSYRPGAIMAGVKNIRIVVRGRSAHGAYPWSSVDPIVISAQIVNNLQTIVSRNLNVTENPGVVTIAAINGGNRTNIIPESVEMLGTFRFFSDEDAAMMEDRIRTIVRHTAEAGGATATIDLPYTSDYPVTFNDPKLMEKMLPSLQRAIGAGNVKLKPPVTGAEDFSFYQKKVPGLFLFVGGMPKGQNPATTPSHHTPDFYIDESGMIVGVKALCHLVVDYQRSL